MSTTFSSFQHPSNEKLEKISCTDMAQKWGATKAAKTVGLFDAKKFTDLCCVKAKKFQAPCIADDVNKSNFRRLVAGEQNINVCVVSSSAVLRVKSKYFQVIYRFIKIVCSFYM